MTSLWLADRAPIETDPLPLGSHVDTVVVGAGVTGIATAARLVEAGQRVVLIDAGRPGGLTTGLSTAKVTVLQQTAVSRIEGSCSAEVADAYLAANVAGMTWLLDRCRRLGVPFDERPACTYATTSAGAERLGAELAALRRSGLTVVDGESTDLPFPTSRVIRLDRQAQLDPTAFCDAAVAALRRDGATVVADCRVRDVRNAAGDDPLEVVTDAGSVWAGHVVLATGAPILDRGLHFSRIEPSRSHAAAYAMRTPPQTLSISVEHPVRSSRAARVGDEELLVVSGFGHVTGRGRPPHEYADRLDAWVRRTFDVTRRVHRWAAQDYRSTDGAPIVGPIRPDLPRLLVATGFNKWGLTNGPAAAMALSAAVLGSEPPSWAPPLYDRRTTTSAVAGLTRLAASTGGHTIGGYSRALSRPAPEPRDEGAGDVGRRGGAIVGVCRVDGELHRVSAVCPHLGGALAWNDAERSWDCPLHGSRFRFDGRRIEGPAVNDLRSQE
ncbi:FAD-dependent oxidoreductase [Pseudoclavibacter endophyticus]|uniref:FAD-dependent oxidoreductase n=1 Tax=Pseudoclavibacter endophyticus TaxID=1778590 RepID=A0A6H9WJH8_9MICO|nr:FAD-dependent oxidoreductase [Pseudoclavibacter endophyticus]KAB1649343.1 FAD-dependent oxidoreductase [Pseudoclavibacter endophyticus]GGA63325.1 FAD-dependent oxidoreductase [Pseudoclavibacter endophyticus]